MDDHQEIKCNEEVVISRIREYLERSVGNCPNADGCNCKRLLEYRADLQAILSETT